MRCRHVRARLVAFQDGELSPGEMQQVAEHLRRCPDCHQLDRRLQAVTPQARLLLPADVLARLHARVDGPVVRGIATERPQDPPPAWSRWVLLLRRELAVPFGAALTYATLLVLALAWGLSNWWTVHTLEARIAVTEGASQRALAQEPIPASHYRPASWTPGEDAGYH